MANKTENWAFCDCCHKAKPESQLQKVVVVSKRCKSCIENGIESMENKPTGIVKKIEKPTFPPADLGECFKPPAELSSIPVSPNVLSVPKEVSPSEENQ